MIKWQEVFSKDGLPWQDADRLSASLAVSDLKDLKRLLDAVHIHLCLVKPYQENKNYPLVEARELLPSFDNDMPEGFIPLAETVTYLALAKKSNTSYAAYLNAAREVKLNGPRPVPLHLRNPSTQLHKEWGYGKEYKYPHNYPESCRNRPR